jgi:hypothetical protein
MLLLFSGPLALRAPSEWCSHHGCINKRTLGHTSHVDVESCPYTSWVWSYAMVVKGSSKRAGRWRTVRHTSRIYPLARRHALLAIATHTSISLLNFEVSLITGTAMIRSHSRRWFALNACSRAYAISRPAAFVTRLQPNAMFSHQAPIARIGDVRSGKCTS